MPYRVFTAKDPIRFNGGDTNLFGYVANNPVNDTDSLGLQEVPPGEGGDTDPWRGWSPNPEHRAPGGGQPPAGHGCKIVYTYKCALTVCNNEPSNGKCIVKNHKECESYDCKPDTTQLWCNGKRLY